MLAWLKNSRHDFCVEISQIASITREKYNENWKKYVKRLNKAITYGHNYPTQLRYPKVDVATLPIVGYSDAAFANNVNYLRSYVGLYSWWTVIKELR